MRISIPTRMGRTWLLAGVSLLLSLSSGPRPCHAKGLSLGGYAPNSRQPVLLREQPDRFELDGVRWGYGGGDGAPEFARTFVQKGAVKDVYYWSENFPPEWIAAHGMLMFVMEDPQALRHEGGRTSIGLALTVEARLPVGERYSIVAGALGRFRLVHLLTTLEDRLQQAILEKDHSIDVYRLPLAPGEKQALLEAAIRGAVTPREPERYNSVLRNCVTEVVDLLDEVLPDDRAPGSFRLGEVPDLRAIVPKVALRWLLKRGVLEPRSTTITQETAHIEFPTTSGTYRVRFADLALPSGAEEGRTITMALRRVQAADRVFEAVQREWTHQTQRPRTEVRADLEEVGAEVDRLRAALWNAIEQDFDPGLSTYVSLSPAPSTSLIPIEYDLFRGVRRRRASADAPTALLDLAEHFLRPRLESHVRLHD